MSAHLLQTRADVHNKKGSQFAALNTSSSIFSSSRPNPELVTSNNSGNRCRCCLDSMIDDLFANMKNFFCLEQRKTLGFVAKKLSTKMRQPQVCAATTDSTGSSTIYRSSPSSPSSVACE